MCTAGRYLLVLLCIVLLQYPFAQAQIRPSVEHPFGPLALGVTVEDVDDFKHDVLVNATLQMLHGVQSSHNCTAPPSGAQSDMGVCELHDVLLFNGSIYYVASSPETVHLPDVSLDWLASGNLTQNQTDYDRGLLKSYLRVTTPAGLPDLSGLPVTAVPEAVFAHFIFYFNYYHVFAEYAPTLHNLLCKFWGKCTYNPQDQLQIFMTSNWDTHWDHLWLKSLISPDFIRFVTTKPVMNTLHPRIQNHVFLVKRALAGWGHECRADHAHCLPWEKRKQPSRDMMQLWRNRVAAVLKYDPKRPAPLSPIKVVVIDRHYSDRNGRAVLNMRQVYKRMKTRYHCHAVEFQLAVVEGMSMQQQAVLYNSATVLLWLHGAAMANLIFLPTNATALQIVHRTQPEELFYWVEELVRDLPNQVQLHHITNEDPDRVILKPGWITKNPIFPKLTAKERLMIWEEKQCPHPEGHEYRHICDEFFFKVGAAVELDPALLFRTLDAVLLKYMQQAAQEKGQELPAAVAANIVCATGSTAPSFTSSGTSKKSAAKKKRHARPRSVKS